MTVYRKIEDADDQTAPVNHRNLRVDDHFDLERFSNRVDYVSSEDPEFRTPESPPIVFLHCGLPVYESKIGDMTVSNEAEYLHHEQLTQRPVPGLKKFQPRN